MACLFVRSPVLSEEGYRGPQVTERARTPAFLKAIGQFAFQEAPGQGWLYRVLPKVMRRMSGFCSATPGSGHLRTSPVLNQKDE